MSKKPLDRLFVVLVSAAAVAMACSTETPVTVPLPVLTGLVQGQSNDTADALPPPPAPGAPGLIKGYVIGKGLSADTIAAAPRLAGVVVTLFTRVGTSLPPVVGQQVAQVTTGVDGYFETPTVPGGEYVVTFRPPENSAYRGVYVPAAIGAQGAYGTWWIQLPPK